MGDYSQNITKRFEHTRIKEGYCLICGCYGRLSIDHVPPKGAVVITKVEQRHITEMIRAESTRIKGVVSSNGAKFKTICHSCNNRHLGGNDSEIANVCKKLTTKINKYYESPFGLFRSIKVELNTIKFTRAMVGHILAATSVNDCRNKPMYSPFFKLLQNFVLGDDTAMSATHDIYYWYYPFDKHLSAKCVGFWNKGHSVTLSLLSFFPIAFMVTEKNRGIYPSHARKLELCEREMILNLSTEYIEYAEFPFHGLKGNQMMVMTDYQTIISHPIK